MSSPDFLPFALPDIGEAEINAVVATLRSGWLTTGPNAAALEKEFVAAFEPERYVGEAGPTGVAVNSATSGLHLALEALGVGPGDEVIVPTWTFTATAEVVRYLGATPVIVDVDATTLNLDLEAAARAVTARTKVVMPVHFAGLPVDRAALAAFARTYNLAVVEDAAHAHPVLSQGIPVGLGESSAVVFSFYATKTMTTGEGGMVVTADPSLAARMRTMRLHGISRDVFDHAWHLYVLRLGADAPLGRDEFIERMAKAGVGTSVHFIPLHTHPYWRELRGPDAPALPVADAQFNLAVSLPIWSAMTTDQVDRVIDAASRLGPDTCSSGSSTSRWAQSCWP